MLAALAGICYAMPLQPEDMSNAHGVGRGGSVLRSHETEQSLDDSRNHTKKLKSKYTGCRWENDVHCGGTAAFPGASGGGAPPTKAEAAAAKKQEEEKPTPYEREMENEKDSEVKPTIFEGLGDEQSLDDRRNQTKKLKGKYTGCRWENDVHCGGTAAFPGASGGDAPPTKAEAAAAKKQEEEKPTPYEREMENEKDSEVKPTIFEGGADESRNQTKKLKSKYNGCRWANDRHCGGTDAPRPGTNGPEKTPADTKDRPDELSPFELEMENKKEADDSASPSVQVFGEDDGAEPSGASSKPTRLHRLNDGHDHTVNHDRAHDNPHDHPHDHIDPNHHPHALKPGDRGIGQ